MGLDMYLEGRKYLWQNWEHPEKDEKRDGFRVAHITLELGYWRKHPDLHGFIVETFADGKDECQDIELSVDDMRKIIAAIQRKKLPHTEGFFFGKSTPEDDAPTIETFEKAIAWVEANRKHEPPAPKFEPLAAGLAAAIIKPEDYAEVKESRSVVYRASW